MTSLKLFFRRARTLVWTSLSILIIFAAALVGLGKLLMPYSQHYQPQLEAWLSKEFGQKVTVESFAGDWNAFGPRLSLRGLRLQPEDGSAEVVALSQAALDLKPLNYFFQNKALYNFLVIGADFRLVHTLEGQYLLSGFGVGGGENGVAGLKNLIGTGELILENSSLEYLDEKRDIRLNLSTIDARIQLDGDNLALELKAGLSDENSDQIFGEIDASGILTLADDSGLKEAHWQVSVGELLMAQFEGRLPSNPFLPTQGQINAEFWCDWDEVNALRVQGAVDIKDGLMVMEDQQTVVEHLNMLVDWKFAGRKHWQLDLKDLTYDDGVSAWSAPRIAIARKVSEDLGLWISADRLPLGAPLRLARNIMSIYGTKWPHFLPGSATGKVENLELLLDRKWQLRLARGTATQASVSDWGKWPDLQGIDAVVDLERGFGRVDFQADQLKAQWPRMFRQPVEFVLPNCQLDLEWSDGWQMAFNACSLYNDDLAAFGNILMSKNEGRPAVDVNVEFSRGNIARMSPYWPQAVLKENVLRWLRRGLVSGNASQGRFQIRGDMDDWPFRQNQGRFEAMAHVDNSVLDYVANWPRAEAIDATARFVNSGMHIEGVIGNISGAKVQNIEARIADLKMPLLQVSYQSNARLEQLVDFVVSTPLNDTIGTDLKRFDITGPADTTGLLTMPMGNTKGSLSVDGNVQILDGRFYDPGSNVGLELITGNMQFTENGIRGSGLESFFKGKPAFLNMTADKNSPERFRADASGVFEVQDILPDFLREGYVELERLQGEAQWLVSIIVPASEQQDPDGQIENTGAELIMRSDLVGVTTDLPDPLRKPASELWPLQVRYPLSGDNGMLELNLKDRMDLYLDIARSETQEDQSAQIDRALISLGNQLGELPPKGMISITGTAETLDLDSWVDIVVDGAKGGQGLAGLKLQESGLQADQLRFLDRRFDNVSIALTVDDEDVRADFSAEDIEGHIVYSSGTGSSASLGAEFERLAMGEPVSSGVDMQSNPGDLPALHLYAKSFQYAGIEMGETRIEAYPTSNGFHFEKVESESEQLSIRASGDWSLGDEGQRSDFKILVTAESLGELMQSLDISSTLEGGQTVLHFNAWWPGSPATFALARLNGELDFNVTRGQITNASAGPGRILGLLSIQALPRRLALDFRDVFDTGFGFEEAKGTFKLENGHASTDDVVLSSSAANISMSGSTDLVAQQYDQLMTINPGLGNTLPIIGALAGGPGGAAAGLALQGLLQKQLGEASQVQYTITGSWNEPSIEPVLKDQPGG